MSETIAEYLADIRWLKATTVAADEQKRFADAWYALAKMSSKLIEVENWQDCDLKLKGTVLADMQVALRAALHHVDNRGIFVAHFTNEFKDGDGYWDLIDEPAPPYQRYAKLYKDFYPYPSASIGWTITDRLWPELSMNAVFLMHVSHGLCDDDPNQPIGFYRMPEWRWATDGTKFDWYDLKNTIQVGPVRYTRKAYEKRQVRMEGF